MIRYSQDSVLLRGYTLLNNFLYIYIVGILHIERCFIDQHHLLKVYSLSYIQYLCSREHFQYACAHDLKKRSLLTERLPRFVTLSHPNVNLRLWRQLKRSFVDHPTYFYNFFYDIENCMKVGA